MFDDPSGYMSVEEKNTAQANMSSMSEATSSAPEETSIFDITNAVNLLSDCIKNLKLSNINE